MSKASGEQKLSEQEIVRRQKADQIEKLGFDIWNNVIKPSHFSFEFRKAYNKFNKEDLKEKENTFKGKEIILNGRIVLYRLQGKAAFLTIQDEFGTTQLYIRSDEVDPKQWKLLELLDLGDIISVSGFPMKTNTNELTLRVGELNILTKAMKPLPDKHSGLVDIDERQRKRYLDLIVNSEVRDVFKKRSKIISETRNYLEHEGFLSVETPMLHPILGGANAKPFITHHNALDMPFFLRVAPELYLKRLIIGGFDKVYEIGPNFRNEGISIRHNPEFTAMELYQAYADVNDMMDICERTINIVNKKVNKKDDIIYQGQKISLKLPFKRVEMIDIVKEQSGIDFRKVDDYNDAVKLAKEKGFHVEKHMYTIGHIINLFFEEMCEKTLIQPTFITGYPVAVSPLAKRRKGSDDITDRFELFIGAREYANGFSELNSSDEQYDRFVTQLKEKELGSDEANEMDYDYIEALSYGLPPTGGLGIGIDRMIMLLTDSTSIRDVLLFPHMRKLEKN